MSTTTTTIDAAVAEVAHTFAQGLLSAAQNLRLSFVGQPSLTSSIHSTTPVQVQGTPGLYQLCYSAKYVDSASGLDKGCKLVFKESNTQSTLSEAEHTRFIEGKLSNHLAVLQRVDVEVMSRYAPRLEFTLDCIDNCGSPLKVQVRPEDYNADGCCMKNVFHVEDYTTSKDHELRCEALGEYIRDLKLASSEGAKHGVIQEMKKALILNDNCSFFTYITALRGDVGGPRDALMMDLDEYEKMKQGYQEWFKGFGFAFLHPERGGTMRRLQDVGLDGQPLESSSIAPLVPEASKLRDPKLPLQVTIRAQFRMVEKSMDDK